MKTSGCLILTNLITLADSREIPAIVFPQYFGVINNLNYVKDKLNSYFDAV